MFCSQMHDWAERRTLVFLTKLKVKRRFFKDFVSKRKEFNIEKKIINA
jgi:hypothetical protein